MSTKDGSIRWYDRNLTALRTPRALDGNIYTSDNVTTVARAKAHEFVK